MAKYSSKINKIRTFALSLVFVGFIIMYIGIFFKESVLLASLFMLLGLLSIGLSTVVDILIGMQKNKEIREFCP
ncbi:DUF2614 family zinc ribbon-containing protein, partial [Bacillus atrophaeus]|uniref:DUF2614 family zinc ribbon-containing protein n=1 Tax=Bacillus atrophaeus TaxID=1452 RepID=UPI002E1C1ED1|nr:DUF2614 family zinc ribbon-containing protein [Bacillus atrophaeus]